LANQNSQLVI